MRKQGSVERALKELQVLRFGVCDEVERKAK